MSSAHRGQFVWHELMTTDTAAAGAFYPRIAGWKTQPWEHEDVSYTMWVGKDGPLGGVMSLPHEEAAPSSHWMPYIGTDDVAATVAAARDLGATVCKDTTPLPNGGSFAVLQDPHGATFAVHASGGSEPAGAQEQTDFSWHELSTGDLEAALDFYSALFGWDAAEKHDMGEMGYYQLFARNGRNIGGMFVTPPGVSPNWLSYVRVSDVDEAADAAKAAGGRVINGPMEVPGGDWIAHIIDPQGAAFAVHEVKSVAQPVKTAQPRKARAKRPVKQAKPAAKAPLAATGARPKRASARKPAKAAGKTAARRAVAKSTKSKRTASPRRSPARAKASAKAKASRKRASARAAAAARSKRSARTQRAPAKRSAAARRRPAARKVARRARRLVRAKRRR